MARADLFGNDRPSMCRTRPPLPVSCDLIPTSRCGLRRSLHYFSDLWSLRRRRDPLALNAAESSSRWPESVRGDLTRQTPKVVSMADRGARLFRAGIVHTLCLFTVLRPWRLARGCLTATPRRCFQAVRGWVGESSRPSDVGCRQARVSLPPPPATARKPVEARGSSRLFACAARYSRQHGCRPVDLRC